MKFDQVSDFVLDPHTTIPNEALEMAALLLLDTTGVGAGAVQMDAGKLARQLAVDMFQAQPGEGVPMMFDGRIVSLAGAAFAGATQIDNLDAHDGYNPTKGHIGCAAVPALYAFAGRQAELTGTNALRALVMSYEVAARAAMALHETVSDYHTSGAWNGLGVVAMGCNLAGTSPEMLKQALGIAEYHGPRSQMMREIATPTMLHDGSGMGALTGVMAVRMASHGFLGAPAITVEADEVAHIWADLGSKWTILDNYIKPYPICRWAHAAIDGVHSLQSAHQIRADHIRRVTVRTFGEAAQLFPGMPDTTSKAQYSLAFAVATILQHGRIGVEHISGNALKDQITASLIERIAIIEDKRHSKRFPAGRWSDVTIELASGDHFESGDIHARGGPESPMDNSEIHEKSQHLCSASLSSDRSEQIWQAGHSLLNSDALFSSLGDLVYPEAEKGSG